MSDKTGLLTVAEMASDLALTSTETQSAQAKALGIDERIWRGIRTGEYSRASETARIKEEYRSKMHVFWSTASDRSVAAIREAADVMHLCDLMNPSFLLEFRELIAFEPTQEELIAVEDLEADPTKDLFGRTYAWAVFASRVARLRISAVDHRDAFARFLMLGEKLQQHLALQPEEAPSVQVLKFRVAWDIFSMEFEYLTPEQRSGEEWREKLHSAGFFAAMDDYNNKIPHAWQVPWNALAFASMLNMEERFDDLIERILKAKKFKTIDDIVSHQKFDEDFANVRQWLQPRLAAE